MHPPFRRRRPKTARSSAVAARRSGETSHDDRPNRHAVTCYGGRRARRGDLSHGIVRGAEGTAATGSGGAPLARGFVLGR